MKYALMMGIAMTALSLGGCAQPQPAKSTESTEPAAPMIGMANPASVYCAKLGGKIRIEKTAAGERGVCVLPSGAEVDEWELFRRDHPAK